MPLRTDTVIGGLVPLASNWRVGFQRTGYTSEDYIDLGRGIPLREVCTGDAACADCGSWSDLFGPFDLQGNVLLGGQLEPGDFVCKPCARSRGYEGPLP